MPRNNNKITIRECTNAGTGTDITNSNMENDSQFGISATYITA